MDSCTASIAIKQTSALQQCISVLKKSFEKCPNPASSAEFHETSAVSYEGLQDFSGKKECAKF